MDIKKLLNDWSISSAMIRKPKLDEACKIIESLCMSINKLEDDLAYQKNRQNVKEQTYKTMIFEIQNVVSKYN